MMKLNSKYVDRAITTTLSVRLSESAAVALLGTRQVGKTTLARDIASDLNARPLRGDRAWYLDLESDRDPAQLTLAPPARHHGQPESARQQPGTER